MSRTWSDHEVRVTVADYFSMLSLELQGKPYIKAHHNHNLRELLNNRSKASVELKHQNISAILIQMGIPYINGYKPRFNYQQALVPAIEAYIKNNPLLHKLLLADVNIIPENVRVLNLLDILDGPPKLSDRVRDTIIEYKANMSPLGINFLEQEALNQKLGDAGERLIIRYERERLTRLGKTKLADRVEQVSITIGPSAGFDIRSFEENGTDRLIEAKTTKYGKNTPFYITPNEVKFSQSHTDNYYLYRLYSFRNNPRLFLVNGSIEGWCKLQPSEYIANPMF